MCKASDRKSDETPRKMVSSLLKAVRPINLVIVAVLQLLLYSTILLPILDNPRLTYLTFGGFVFSTVLLTTSGYLINDYFDYKGDQINKKDWHQLSQSQLLKATMITTVLGCISSFWVACSIDKLSYILLFFAASALLYSYSSWGKRQPLIGNIMVAAFCGLSLTVLLLAEWPALMHALDNNPIEANQAISLILGLSAFAFLITLVREIVKDVEDVEGDKSQGYHTLPIKIGIARTQLMIIWYLILTLILAVWWGFSQWNFQSVIANLYFTLGVIGSLLYLIYRAYHLHGNASYTELSKLCKYAMVIGMIYVTLV